MTTKYLLGFLSRFCLMILLFGLLGIFIKPETGVSQQEFQSMVTVGGLIYMLVPNNL